MNKKDLTIWVLFLALVVIILVGVLWCVNNRLEEIDKAGDVEVVIPEKPIQIADTLNIEDVDTSNWKTYRNEELGFEVRYPEDWGIEDLPFGPELQKGATFVAPGRKKIVSIVRYSHIKEIPKRSSETLDTSLVEHMKDEQYNDVIKVNVNGNIGYYAWLYNETIDLRHENILFEKKSYIFKIGYGNTEQEMALVSTFKILDQ